MKSNTPESMKFRRLQRRLGTSKCQTVGMLELLWIATAKNSPAGDIGRFSNEEIAIECDWEGSPDELVAALLECGWLDQHDECRLVIHDWADHCPHHITANLRRWGKQFMQPPKEPPRDDPREHPPDSDEFTKDDPKEHAPLDTPTKPSQAKSSQVKPRLAKPSRSEAEPEGGCGRAAAAIFLEKAKGDEVRMDANRLLRECPTVDKDLLWQVAWIGRCIDAEFVTDLVDRIKHPTEPIRSRSKYLKAAIRREIEERHLLMSDCLELCPKAPQVRQAVG